MDNNYSEYSLKKLEEWLFDVIHNQDVSVSEICQTIFNFLDQEEESCELQLHRIQSLRKMMQSKTNQTKTCDINDDSEYCKSSWNSFWQNDTLDFTSSESENTSVTFDDKVNSWILPVEIDGPSGECFVTFPNDLLNQLDWKEGDKIEYIDNKNGSFTIKKVK